MTTRLLEGLLVLVCVFCAFLYMGCMDESNTATKLIFAASMRPEVTSMAPARGPLAGGTTVILKGKNFGFEGNAIRRIGFGSKRGTITKLTATEVRVVTPAQTKGGPTKVEITYWQWDTQAAAHEKTLTLDQKFVYYAPPTVTSVDPPSGRAGGGTTITITGTGFQDNDAGTNTVTVDGQAATNVQVNSDTEITAETPAGTSGGDELRIRSMEIEEMS